MAELNFIPFLGHSVGNALDYFTAADAIFPNGSGGPPSVGRNSHPLVPFPDDADVSRLFEGSMGNDYNGALVTVDVFWVAESAVAGDVVWFLAWERDNAGHNIDANSFAAEKSVVSPAPAASGDIQKATVVFTQAEADGVAPGDPYRLRLRRAGGSGSDDMTGNAQFKRINIEGI